MKLSKDYPDVFGNSANEHQTIFSKATSNGSYELLKDRPGLLVSSTSWTEDEDFSILLEALTDYDNRARESQPSEFPPLICAITGKGPLKEYYRNVINRSDLKHVKIILPWLEPEDYPLLLACADLGVSLHTSSSGLDLPMKVVDMFGCGLPVAAKKFPALSELVQDGVNGMVFEHTEELSEQIANWFQGFPSRNEDKRKGFQKRLEEFQALRWKQHWQEVVPSLLEDM